MMKVLCFRSSQGGLGKKGSERAPDMILESLRELHLSESGGIINIQKTDVRVAESNIMESGENLEKSLRDNFESGNKDNNKDNKKLMILGGDHSLTYFSFRAFSEVCRNGNKYSSSKNPKNSNGRNPENPDVGLIVFDAHPDCMENFRVTHEDYLRVLIEEGFVRPENVILVGLRNWHRNEYNYLKKRGIKYFTMRQVYDDKEGVCDTIMELARGRSDVYVSIDIDFLDPAFAPGTGYCEAGGAGTRDLLYFLSRLKLLRNIRAYDLVEIIPDKDIGGCTVSAGAKIIAEIAG